MFDLHCHLLPGIDDGAVDLEMALAMARMAVADGIITIACTPHIYPGMYDNNAAGIRAAVAALQAELDARGIALRLVEGADVHLDPDLLGWHPRRPRADPGRVALPAAGTAAPRGAAALRGSACSN